MTDRDFDVIVAGGGPVGMWLAAELCRGGVSTAVLERRAERTPHSKAMTILPRTIELLAMRGIHDRWLAEGTAVPSSHFALLTSRLDFSFMAAETSFPYALFLPQRRTEELLRSHLDELGVPFLPQHEVTGLLPDEDGVWIDVAAPSGPARFRASYVAGCDGANSVVRQAAGIEFAGTPSTWTSILGDVDLTDPPAKRALTLNQPGGSLFMLPLGGSRHRLATIDHATLDDPVGKPVTFADLRDSVVRLTGSDFGMLDSPDAWFSRVGNETRQAVSYRRGRVLLAGDAAHVHFPAGGQGLNLGLADATNLGWKLAASVRGWAPPWLLDSYCSEREPAGLEVIEDSRAQCALFASPSPDGVALRDRFNAILGAHPSLNRELAFRLSGLALRYDSGPGRAGQRIPGAFGLMRRGRFVLISPAPADVPGYEDRLDVVSATLSGAWSDTASVLIRPDGYVAWSLNQSEALSPPPLEHWLGPPTT
jgi:2-polyprenyl-6-methoxyphenol hydroxylase-like FAD-dependent oxidoreductase